ncbi:MAG: 2-oxo-4-hydroxy-4-carboxy-5-ureidoimidazoline decarboxylase [Gammaproteobacteria bacterium]|nr:2-oxo-4-hydroxy-4-carboxy-5-ureidoimidazoline decarboxylase [Gammaproteobacteria bacterium]
MSTPPRHPLPFSALQALDQRGFAALLGPVVEHSAWVAVETWNARPFKDWEALAEAMTGTLLGASPERQLALLRVHPELAGQEALAGTMTPDSLNEQGRLGLLRLSSEAFQKLGSLNQRYQARFGFPFVVALRLHDSLDSVFASLESRLNNDADTERELAVGQVVEVMRGRWPRCRRD